MPPDRFSIGTPRKNPPAGFYQPRPTSIFSQALDLFTADVVQVFRHVFGFSQNPDSDAHAHDLENSPQTDGAVAYVSKSSAEARPELDSETGSWRTWCSSSGVLASFPKKEVVTSSVHESATPVAEQG